MEIEPNPQSIDEALDWHSAITDSVTSHRAIVLRNSSRESRFIGLTVEEIDEYFATEYTEIDGMCAVNIIAAAEAAIRFDYRNRIRQSRTDPLSQAYIGYRKTLSGYKQFRPDFDKGGILDAMRSAGSVPLHLVSDFRHALKVRHWYAHGRHWLLKTNSTTDPNDVHAVCNALLVAVGAV